jgi:hypothetical protein
MGIETTVAMAIAMGRTLVMPPVQTIYLLEKVRYFHCNHTPLCCAHDSHEYSLSLNYTCCYNDRAITDRRINLTSPTFITLPPFNNIPDSRLSPWKNSFVVRP